MKKYCRKCNQDKETAEFHDCFNGVGKKAAYCKTCMKAYAKIYQRELKQEIINHYGGCCVCCGEKMLEFLAIHHVNRDGYKDGRRRGGYTFYLRIKRENFPENLEPLCHNCNMGIEANDGICPHKENR
jgi:hypothetical protein